MAESEEDIRMKSEEWRKVKRKRVINEALNAQIEDVVDLDI